MNGGFTPPPGGSGSPSNPMLLNGGMKFERVQMNLTDCDDLWDCSTVTMKTEQDDRPPQHVYCSYCGSAHPDGTLKCCNCGAGAELAAIKPQKTPQQPETIFLEHPWHEWRNCTTVADQYNVMIHKSGDAAEKRNDYWWPLARAEDAIRCSDEEIAKRLRITRVKTHEFEDGTCRYENIRGLGTNREEALGSYVTLPPRKKWKTKFWSDFRAAIDEIKSPAGIFATIITILLSSLAIIQIVNR